MAKTINKYITKINENKIEIKYTIEDLLVNPDLKEKFEEGEKKLKEEG